MSNNDLDHILKNLRDYDPHGKPDWEAFAEENNSRLPQESGTGDISLGRRSGAGKGLWYGGAVVVILAGFFGLWYFSGNDTGSQTETNSPVEDVISLPSGESNSVSDEVITGADDFSIESPKQVAPIGIKGNINPVLDISKPSVIVPSHKAADNIIIQPDRETEIIEAENTIIHDTIVIRKTITVTDTIKLPKIKKK